MVKNSYLKIISLLIVMAFVMQPVMGIVNNDGYEMKYVDNNPTHTLTEDDVTGGVIFNIRAGGSAEDLLVFVSRDGTNVTPFDSYYHPDQTEVVGQNPGYRQVKVLADGNSKIIRFTPGNYTAWMRNGNSGQMEKQPFVVGLKSLEVVPFLGHAVSSSKHPSVNNLNIIKAVYGTARTCEMVLVPAVTEIVHHDAETHTITVVDKEAYDETIIDTPSHSEYRFKDYVVDVPEHVNTVVDVPAHTEYQYRDYVVDVPAHTETVVDVPAHTEYQYRDYVVDVPAHTETVVDVPAHTEYQYRDYIVDVPEHTEYRYPTGHFSVHDTKCFDYDYVWVGWHYEKVCVETKVKCTNHAEHGEGWHIETPACTGVSSWSAWQTSDPHKEGQETRVVPATYKWTDWSAFSDTTETATSTHEVKTRGVAATYKDVPVPATYKWTDWSVFSDTPETATATHEVNTREVSATYKDVPVPATYKWTDWSEWSDSIAIASETKQVETREVQAQTHIVHHDAVTHQETVTDKESWDETVIITPEHNEEVCTGGDLADVTSIVKGLVKNGELHIKAKDYNGLFGSSLAGEGQYCIASLDSGCEIPSPMKELTVDYNLNGVAGTKKVPENVDINIP